MLIDAFTTLKCDATSLVNVETVVSNDVTYVLKLLIDVFTTSKCEVTSLVNVETVVFNTSILLNSSLLKFIVKVFISDTDVFSLLT